MHQIENLKKREIIYESIEVLDLLMGGGVLSNKRNIGKRTEINS
jgi:hypothetical protein